MASTYLNLRIHVIFSTLHRAPSIAPDWKDDLHAYLGGAARGLGAFSIQIGGTTDHVDLLLGVQATHCVGGIPVAGGLCGVHR
ncbi:MAG: transposase [Armatimonadetes bacterium]|nr:transposase [Armatimonadota bacterium]